MARKRFWSRKAIFGAQLLVWRPNLKARAAVGRALRVAGAAQRTSIVLDLRPSLTR